MITKNFKKFLIIPIAIIIIGVIIGFVNGGFHLGVDLTGGRAVSIDMKGDFDVQTVEIALQNNGIMNASVVKSGEKQTQAEIKMPGSQDDALQTKTEEAILEEVQATYPDATIVAANHITRAVGKEFVNSTILGLLVAAVLVFVYIWIRFGLISGVNAIVMLLINLAVLTAVVLIFRIEITISFLAVYLAAIGFSAINMVAVYNKIKSKINVPDMQNISCSDISDVSIKETRARILNPSIAVLIVLIAVCIVAPAVRGFALSIIIGILATMYSSILLTAPMWAAMAKGHPQKGKKNNTAKQKKKTAKA